MEWLAKLGILKMPSWEKVHATYLVGGEKFVNKLTVLHQLLLNRSPLPDTKGFMLQLVCTSPSLG